MTAQVITFKRTENFDSLGEGRVAEILDELKAVEASLRSLRARRGALIRAYQKLVTVTAAVSMLAFVATTPALGSAGYRWLAPTFAATLLESPVPAG